MSLIESAIRTLIDLELEFKDKLELLTSIGIDSSNEQVFQSCEKIRDELVEGNQERKDKVPDDISCGESGESIPDYREKEFDEIFDRENAISQL